MITAQNLIKTNLTTKKAGEKLTLFMHIKSFKDFKNQLIQRKESFTVSQTGYTSTIKGDKLPFNYVFSTSGKSKKVIFLHSKVKKAVRASKIYLDEVQTDKVKYFDLSRLTPCKKKVVYNVDISQAYPQQLKNFGFIGEDLFTALMKESKKDRLKAIGMLATQRSIATYEKGEFKPPIEFKTEETRNVFFAICQEVGESIERAARNCPSFLFYWFDGIYFTNKRDVKKVVEILQYCGFSCKVEKLENFYVGKTERVIYISYYKEGKRKRFIMPVMNNGRGFEKNKPINNAEWQKNKNSRTGQPHGI